MKILIVSCVFYPEPLVSAKISRDLAEQLSMKNNKVVVICPTPSRPIGFNYDYNIQDSLNYEVNRLNSFTFPGFSFFNRMRESISFGIETARAIKKKYYDFDVIYVNTWPLFAQYFTIKIAKKTKIPVILHIQDIYPEALLNKFHNVLGKMVVYILYFIEKYNINNAWKVVTISERMKNTYLNSRQLPKNKVTMVYNWQDELAYKQIDSLVIHETCIFQFMYLGNIGETSGLIDILHAFNNAKLSNCKLIIAGDGSQRSKLERLTEELSTPNVEFVSVKPGDEVLLQNSADVLLLPLKANSSMFSIPSKLPGYMFSRKPVLALLDETSDSATVIKISNCGWVGKPGDVSWITMKLSQISKMSSTELLKLGNNGYEFAMKEFSKGKNLSALANLVLDKKDDQISKC